MLQNLELTNVGPAQKMRLDFGERLNLITGDNGLGKSFLLDIAWWALTRKWPAEVNPRLTAGKMALPSGTADASIDLSFSGKIRNDSFTSRFDRREQAWSVRRGRPANPGMVLYAMSDGSFSVWDSARNYRPEKRGSEGFDRPPAYVFSPNEIWDGLPGTEGKWHCNGLIRDWASWQKEDGASFRSLRSVMDALSNSSDQVERIIPGELTRISLDDVRDMPTIRMPYRQDVAVAHASAGIRRIMALAYALVWTWEEHSQASKLLGEDTADQVVFLVDEIEAHLHPKWQFGIVPSLLSVMNALTRNAQVQVITATHSPMIMASIEPIFDPKKDSWFDLDYAGDGNGEVKLSHRDFERHGDISNWLTSEAFDLPSPRTPEFADLLAKAGDLIKDPNATIDAIRGMHERLVLALNPRDTFLYRWRAICEKKGWSLE